MKRGSSTWIVRYTNTPNSQCHWYIERYTLDNRRERKWFRTQEDAQKYADDRNKEQFDWGKGALTAEERAMANFCIFNLTAWGKTLLDATDFYIQHLERMHHKMSVAQLGERAEKEFMRRLKNHEIGTRHFGSIKQIIKKLTIRFGEIPITAVKGPHLRNWIAGMDVAPASKNWARLYSSVIFGYAKEAGLLDENPAADISGFKNRARKDPGILTVTQLQTLLEKAEPEIVPAIAIGGFAGLRSAEIERLDWREIHFHTVTPNIEVKAEKAKTAQRRFVDISGNLMRWLKPFQRQEGPIFPPPGTPGGRVFMERAIEAAGLNPWPRNALRHSFCSYHLALHESSDKIARQAGHLSAATTYSHYFQLVTKDEALKYWAIVPAEAYADEILHSRISDPDAATLQNRPVDG